MQSKRNKKTMKKYIIVLGLFTPTLLFGQIDRSIRPQPSPAPTININITICITVGARQIVTI